FFTTKGNRGTGLGLAQVFGIVERHAGRLEVHSAPEQGTTVRIYLPGVTAAAPAIARVIEPVATRKLRILAVDDEPLIGKMVARLVRTDGHVVVTATSGEEALERLREGVFDVVLSDVGMGAGMNGWGGPPVAGRQCLRRGDWRRLHADGHRSADVWPGWLRLRDVR